MPHSPGPWLVETNDLRDGKYFTVRMPDDGFEPLDLHEDENGESNAHLIAAAPEMYKALDAVLQDFGMMSHGSIKLAADALAKARGETST